MAPRCAILPVMRWILGLFLLVACAAHPQQRISPPAPGALALVETATDLAGNPIGASPARTTIVIVLASWCEHCAAEIATLDTLRKLHPTLRIIGVSYHSHENYDHRGNPEALKRYAGNHSWLPIVLADDSLFEALGSPPGRVRVRQGWRPDRSIRSENPRRADSQGDRRRPDSRRNVGLDVGVRLSRHYRSGRRR
jgi:thiol-disulfide isomerase/thioredoxin